MSWFPLILLLCLTINNLSEASHSHKLHSAIVVGSVLCDDSCFEDNISKSTHFISGASVAVKCKEDGFRQEVKTNKHGEFKVSLPFSVTKHVKEIKRCSVKVVNSSDPNCGVPSTVTSSSIHLKSRSNAGTHIFSAGFFSFRRSEQSNLSRQKANVEEDAKQVNSQKTLGFGQPQFPEFPPPLQDPATPQPITTPSGASHSTTSGKELEKESEFLNKWVVSPDS